jgi:hypothetical protein
MTPFENDGLRGWYKRSPLFLPEKHARTFVHIESVRVERLQDISEDDAVAEGIIPVNQCGILRCCGYKDYTEDKGGFMMAKKSFETLWNSINEKRGHGWDKNEWVVAVEYKMIGREEAYE